MVGQKNKTNPLTLLNSICRNNLWSVRMSVSAEVLARAPLELDQLEREISNTVGPLWARGTVRALPGSMHTNRRDCGRAAVNKD